MAAVMQRLQAASSAPAAADQRREALVAAAELLLAPGRPDSMVPQRPFAILLATAIGAELACGADAASDVLIRVFAALSARLLNATTEPITWETRAFALKALNSHAMPTDATPRAVLVSYVNALRPAAAATSSRPVPEQRASRDVLRAVCLAAPNAAVGALYALLCAEPGCKLLQERAAEGLARASPETRAAVERDAEAADARRLFSLDIEEATANALLKQYAKRDGEAFIEAAAELMESAVTTLPALEAARVAYHAVSALGTLRPRCATERGAAVAPLVCRVFAAIGRVHESVEAEGSALAQAVAAKRAEAEAAGAAETENAPEGDADAVKDATAAPDELAARATALGDAQVAVLRTARVALAVLVVKTTPVEVAGQLRALCGALAARLLPSAPTVVAGDGDSAAVATESAPDDAAAKSAADDAVSAWVGRLNPVAVSLLLDVVGSAGRLTNMLTAHDAVPDAALRAPVIDPATLEALAAAAAPALEEVRGLAKELAVRGQPSNPIAAEREAVLRRIVDYARGMAAHARKAPEATTVPMAALGRR